MSCLLVAIWRRRQYLVYGVEGCCQDDEVSTNTGSSSAMMTTLLLSDADVATLRHLVESGMGANTLRTIASDLAFLERLALAATGAPLPWPAPASLVVKFI
jgi:hypothetical protein